MFQGFCNSLYPLYGCTELRYATSNASSHAAAVSLFFPLLKNQLLARPTALATHSSACNSVTSRELTSSAPRDAARASWA